MSERVTNGHALSEFTHRTKIRPTTGLARVEAGNLRVITKTFEHIQPSAFGKINLTFEPVINNATVSGIEILDESG